MITQTANTELTLEQLDDVNGGVEPITIGIGIGVGVSAVIGFGVWYFSEDAGDAAGSASNIKDKINQTPEERLAERMAKTK